MKAQISQRTIYTDQIRTTWDQFGLEQQAWAMLKMPDDLRTTLHRIIDVTESKKNIKEMLKDLKTPTTVASAYGSIVDQIRGHPELKLLEFLNAVTGETQ